MLSQSMQPVRHFLCSVRMEMISREMFSSVLPVTSNSHTFSFVCSCRASMRQTSNISEARFSQSLVPEKPRFSMKLRSSMGFRRRTKMRVTWRFGTTAAA